MQSHIEYRKVVHMANKTYLTVKEVSEILGVSKQAIYKRMSTDLSTYVVLVEKQKYLKYEVLKHLSVNHSTQKVEQSAEVESLKKLVEILEKENELKQQTIERLEARNEEEHKHLLELTSKVGNTLQSLTQGQLADKLIEGKKILSEQEGVADLPAEAPHKKKHWWQK